MSGFVENIGMGKDLSEMTLEELWELWINAKTWGVSAAFTTEEGVQDETNYQK